MGNTSGALVGCEGILDDGDAATIQPSASGFCNANPAPPQW